MVTTKEDGASTPMYDSYMFKMYKLTTLPWKATEDGALERGELGREESCRDFLYANLTPFKAATRDVAECQRGQTDTLRAP